MNTISNTHLVLIPSYNSGPLLVPTIRSARAAWGPVLVVIDGSTDGTDEVARRLAAEDSGLYVLHRLRNGGKGEAVLDGLREAERLGFTHVLTMDGDGQHEATLIPHFMAVSRAEPRALVLGLPVFDENAPRIRLYGRRLSNWCVKFQTLGAGVGDSLFGFRVYPLRPLKHAMERTRWMRSFDFDPEAVVRLVWAGLPVINLPAPVRYLSQSQGGISHFNYVHHNLLLAWMNIRLFFGLARRLAFPRTDRPKRREPASNPAQGRPVTRDLF